MILKTDERRTELVISVIIINSIEENF